MVEDPRDCPFCAETIKAQAIYCRFCGHQLDGHAQAAPGQISGDQIKAGDLNDVKGTAIGSGAQAAISWGCHGLVDLAAGHSDRSGIFWIPDLVIPTAIGVESATLANRP